MTTLYASAGMPERTHALRLMDGAAQTLRLSLNGLLPVDATVTSATWERCGDGVVSLGASDISISRVPTVVVTADGCGSDLLTLTAVLSTGETVVQRVVVTVQ